MKTAIWLSSILAIVAISFSVAQNEEDPKRPRSLIELFHVGDHLGYSRNADLSGYVLTLYTDQDIQKVKDYYAKRKENDEKRNAFEEQYRALIVRSADKDVQKKNAEVREELQKKIDEVSRPTSSPIGKVFAIGVDYIGLVGLDSGAELYIPISGIASVSRKLSVPKDGIQK